MTAKEKYDSIIQEIENSISSQLGKKAGYIAEKLAQQQGCSLRDLSATFSFLTGQPLIGYIRQRQMMAAYRCILDSSAYDFNEAISYTGCADQSAFNKLFKQCFQITPKQASRDKNSALLLPAMTWEAISATETVIGGTEEVQTVNVDTLFGIEKEKVAKLTEALDCQGIYGFNLAQSEAAYELAERLKAPMKDCFEFVDDYCIQAFSDSNQEEVDAARMKENILATEFLARICLRYDLSVSQGMDVLTEFASIGLDMETLDPRVVELYLEGDFDIRTFWRVYNWGLDHELILGKMEEFLKQAAANWPNLDVALALTDDLVCDDGDMTIMSHNVEEFRRETGYELEHGETDFSHYERFDEEYDEENLGYDDDEGTDGIE